MDTRVYGSSQIGNSSADREAFDEPGEPGEAVVYRKVLAFHLGELKRGFESGELDEDLVENADETHFVFNMDNGRTVGMRGDEHVKYADVASGDEGITMMVRITGGRNARVEAPMLVSKFKLLLSDSWNCGQFPGGILSIRPKRMDRQTSVQGVA